jgi:hypothetical protein
MKSNRFDSAMAHNQYSVSRQPQHYIQCLPEQEETLLDRVLGYTAFAVFLVLMAFVG